MKMFGSDNFAGVHPAILNAIMEANAGHVKAYGADNFTAHAQQVFTREFGAPVDVFFVFNGTAANVLALRAATQSYSAVLCAETAHINVDECGAPESHTGCKLLTVPTRDGKLSSDVLKRFLGHKGNEHHAQPAVVSISQTTELGTVYSIREMADLVNFAHDNGMFVHVDGARIANAVASLNCSLNELLVQTGVDVISFGGTKNGMMFGEAVVFLNRKLSENFRFLRKQEMQLASKMRYVSAQYLAFFENGLWLKNARHANAMALLLAEQLSAQGFRIEYPVQGNAVFATFPKEIIEKAQAHSFFYIWDDEASVVRLMASFDTTEDDIRKFVQVFKI